MILDGKKVRDEILLNIKKEIDDNNYHISFAIIEVGNYGPSNVYINNKIKACEKTGINAILYKYDSATEEEIINLIEKLNKDDSITGIILQSPVPNNINIENCIKHISPSKDIDGFTKDNFYNLAHNQKGIHPCTAKGIIRLLEYYNIDLTSKDVCIIGRGNLVGKPMIFELLNKNATIMVCHSKTKDLKAKTLNADIIICAAGCPKLLTADMVKDKAVVVDAGVTILDGKVIGDADYESLKDKCAYITPNPGGVGPMTIAMIIENLLEAYKEGE